MTVGRELPPQVTFLGFSGAPWTVATYMIAGRGTADQRPARLFAYEHPEAFAALIDLLVEASTGYLVRQFEAGVAYRQHLRIVSVMECCDAPSEAELGQFLPRPPQIKVSGLPPIAAA